MLAGAPWVCVCIPKHAKLTACFMEEGPKRDCDFGPCDSKERIASACFVVLFFLLFRSCLGASVCVQVLGISASPMPTRICTAQVELFQRAAIPSKRIQFGCVMAGYYPV